MDLPDGVEITGPTDRRMTINALDSGAKVWLADHEDANTPPIRATVLIETYPAAFEMDEILSELLVRTCHRRGAHAIGGMAAFIPSEDEEVNAFAYRKLTEDKQKEGERMSSTAGGAHPGMVEACREAIDKVLVTTRTRSTASARTCTSPPASST